MTPANRARVEKVVETLQELRDQDPNAQVAALVIIEACQQLHIILLDLVFRPRSNH
jgi:hypothetical protein